ncbi:MAG: cobalt ECF transporter T component CbiQ [Desulfobacteraceae bacterium]|nr:cobalt ECF transporter T component CbiQ [Desulfobacteraceae bacterium]
MNFQTAIDRLANAAQTATWDSFSGDGRTRGLRAWDARIKLPLLVAVVGLNVVIAQLWLSLFLFLVGISFAIWSGISWRLFALFFLAPAWATLAVFVGFSVGFGQTPVMDFGPFTIYREGMLQGASAAARVACDMSWMAVVFLTTPFSHLLGTLRWFRVPRVLVETLAMAYRYAFLLCEEFSRMCAAALNRGGFGSYKRSLRTLGMILAQVILRAFDRARAVQASMMARGEGGVPESCPERVSNNDDCPNLCDITPGYVLDGVPLLSCTGVSFARGVIKVLEDVSLEVAPGELLFLCGPNGAGKSTFLSLAAGLLIPDSGEIRLGGARLDRKTRKEAFRRVGLLSQDPNDQLFCTHVRDDVAFGAVNRGLGKAEVERLVSTAMELMEVTNLSDRPIHNLSYGEMRRVGLAGLIAMQPPLILLDEPAAGLDPVATRHLSALIRHLNDHHGYTFIIVTHDIDLAASLARRIVILDRGRIVADSTARDILTDTALLENSRLEPPVLASLFQRLAADSIHKSNIPLTIEEALELLRGKVG